MVDDLPSADSAPDSTLHENLLDLEEGESYLVVMGAGSLQRIPLSGRNSLVIGRAEDADVRLVDPLISRRHAIIHIGQAVELEDLGSANGSRVGNQAVRSGQRLEVKAGESIGVGSTLLVIQKSRTIAPGQRFFQHAYFEARVDDECSRAKFSRSSFALVRLGVSGKGSPEAGDWLVHALPAGATLGLFGRDEYEALLPVGVAEAESAIASLVEQAPAARLSIRYGIASFPEDGVSRESLMQHASLELHGPPSMQREFIVKDPAMERLYQLARQVAVGTISVLVLGETGAGKEVIAAAIHDASPRAKQPFLRLNCAAFSETLIESELFGHERGAFTGAAQAKAGLLETADGGTVFLDEVGELSLATQAKLLRVIETHEVTRVGGLKSRQIDVRFVAATNKDLEQHIEKGTFRQDLFFRLNGVILKLPPLRERRVEIEALALKFARDVAEQLGRPNPTFSREAMAALTAYAWPGNIRELRNTIERAVLLCDGVTISASDLPLDRMTAKRANATTERPADDPERERILQALRDCAGNQTRAAKLLGISRRTLLHRLDEYGIERPHGASG